MKNEILWSLKKSPQNTKPTNWKPNWNPRTKKKKWLYHINQNNLFSLAPRSEQAKCAARNLWTKQATTLPNICPASHHLWLTQQWDLCILLFQVSIPPWHLYSQHPALLTSRASFKAKSFTSYPQNLQSHISCCLILNLQTSNVCWHLPDLELEKTLNNCLLNMFYKLPPHLPLSHLLFRLKGK